MMGLALVAFARPARACGVWHLTDHQRKVDVEYLIETASVRKAKRRIGVLYMVESPTGLRVTEGRRVVFDIVDGALRRRGKRVGTLGADGALTIGARAYTIALTDPGTLHGMPSWHVEVKDGDTVIAAGDASSLCAGMHRDPPMSEAEQQDEIRRRVAYYLAWRQLGK